MEAGDRGIDMSAESEKEKIAQALGYSKEQIAFSDGEINENTKVYVGKLSKDIFKKISKSVERIFVSFPDREVRRFSIEIGGKNVQEIKAELAKKGIELSGYTESMMSDPAFVEKDPKKTIDLVRISLINLFDLNPESSYELEFSEIINQALELGLNLSPAVVGPEYCLQYPEEITDDVYVGMKPLIGYDKNPHIFVPQRSGDDKSVFVSDYWARSDDPYFSENEFIFSV